MSKQKSKGQPVTGVYEQQCAATQRILDSMPAMIDEIKAKRERDAWKLRKAVREQEKSKAGRDASAAGPL